MSLCTHVRQNVYAGPRVLDEPNSAKPAQRSSHTDRSASPHIMDMVPAYVDWRACTATPLSGIS
jgi:hypothetical protein